MKTIDNICVKVVEKPKRKAIIKRGVKASDYCEYCDEVGCDIWEILCGIKSSGGEPVCLLLPDSMIREGTSKYVQGVEVPCDCNEEIPEGFEIIELPAVKYLMFQGQPFKEENIGIAMEEVRNVIDKCIPCAIGYELDTEHPRILLEPICSRGHIELIPIK